MNPEHLRGREGLANNGASEVLQEPSFVSPEHLRGREGLANNGDTEALQGLWQIFEKRKH